MISAEYLALQEQMHREKEGYGISGARYAKQVASLAKKLPAHTILDYGCGKRLLQKALGYAITNYDPAIPEFAARPKGRFDLVVCTDVMEHIEPEHEEAVIDDIANLTETAAFFSISLQRASKHLPDGRNAHINLKSIGQWIEALERRFIVVNVVRESEGAFYCTCEVRK